MCGRLERKHTRRRKACASAPPPPLGRAAARRARAAARRRPHPHISCRGRRCGGRAFRCRTSGPTPATRGPCRSGLGRRARAKGARLSLALAGPRSLPGCAPRPRPSHAAGTAWPGGQVRDPVLLINTQQGLRPGDAHLGHSGDGSARASPYPLRQLQRPRAAAPPPCAGKVVCKGGAAPRPARCLFQRVFPTTSRAPACDRRPPWCGWDAVALVRSITVETRRRYTRHSLDLAAARRPPLPPPLDRASPWGTGRLHDAGGGVWAAGEAAVLCTGCVPPWPLELSAPLGSKVSGLATTRVAATLLIKKNVIIN